MKRAFDVLGATAALLILSPVMLVAALAIVIETGWPVSFRQIRVGRGGREFGMFKLRSMVVDAASVGPHFTAAYDPRVTRVGRFIRRTSVDELPQLINVIVGDMSLVGPRPDVPMQRSLYEDAEWLERVSVRPGITGLAQVILRSDGTHEDRLALDLRYVREHSLLLDMRILVGTLSRLSGKGGN